VCCSLTQLLLFLLCFSLFCRHPSFWHLLFFCITNAPTTNENLMTTRMRTTFSQWRSSSSCEQCQQRRQSMVRSTRTKKTSLEYIRRASGLFLRPVLVNHLTIIFPAFHRDFLLKTWTRRPLVGFGAPQKYQDVQICYQQFIFCIQQMYSSASEWTSSASKSGRKTAVLCLQLCSSWLNGNFSIVSATRASSHSK